MELKDILLAVIVISALGYSFYKKYKLKNGSPKESGKSSSGSHSNDLKNADDSYEPYQKK